MMNAPSAPYPAAPSTLSHPQALQQGLGPHPPPPPPPGMGHPVLQPPPLHSGNHMLQPLPPPGAGGGGGGHGGRKVAEADAPPNVTVSTSTIPLSMAASLQQHPPPDLSAIVHQINQFCQARAGASATSVCEGQIANPSPISRNLLISASSRVSAHQGHPLPSCAQANPGDPTLGAMHLASAAGRGPSAAYQSEMKQAVAAAAWNQHQLAHLQRMCGEAVGPSGLAGKLGAGRELPGQAFSGAKAASGYGLELCTGPPFGLKPPLEKPTPSPPVNGLPGPLTYTNGPYFQPLWNNILPTPNSDSSGSQDLAIPFHATTGQPPPPPMGPALECTGGPPPYRGGPGGAPPSQGGSMMPSMEYLSGDLPTACLREQGGGMLGKAPRPSVNRGPESVMDSRSLHIQHPGYR
ncbi:hypothetical protein JRQ81_008395 [Phrynocephalus forsythii]|uniref:Protein FAM222B n=1 Tax=Phrynocephalus forsythii TaxID=171643 RepID=A0A9Q1AT50_9SAUR|nr:hypothetical protein JRQ81_008395 [Phrynocephalus forsythii]